MYEALQYFQGGQFQQLVELLLTLCDEKAILLFSSIPDEDKLWGFYDTPERQREYEARKRNGTEAIGNWWKKDSIRKICSKYNLQCEFLSQPADFHTFHYRFDVRIKRQ